MPKNRLGSHLENQRKKYLEINFTDLQFTEWETENICRGGEWGQIWTHWLEVLLGYSEGDDGFSGVFLGFELTWSCVWGTCDLEVPVYKS